jgi:hypothetical protein
MTDEEELQLERQVRQVREKQNKEIKQNLDEVTAILCGLMKKLEKNDALNEATVKAKQWFKKHKEIDKINNS